MRTMSGSIRRSSVLQVNISATSRKPSPISRLSARHITWIEPCQARMAAVKLFDVAKHPGAMRWKHREKRVRFASTRCIAQHDILQPRRWKLWRRDWVHQHCLCSAELGPYRLVLDAGNHAVKRQAASATLDSDGSMGPLCVRTAWTHVGMHSVTSRHQALS